LVTAYHYTNKKGYNGINSTSPIEIQPNTPTTRNNPTGAYVTLDSPDVVDLGQIGLTNKKATHVFEVQVPRSELVQLGDRPVFYAPDGLTVDRCNVTFCGQRGSWPGGE